MNRAIKYVPFLRWWLFFCIIILGSVALILSGIIQQVSQADVTKISFLIYMIFGYFSIRTGLDTYYLCNNRNITEIIKRKNTEEFVANILLTLGMIGTVIGFIYMLTTCFVGIDAGNIHAMKSLLMKMSVGMGTALYTTAAGLICSLLLRLQLFNLEYYLKNENKG